MKRTTVSPAQVGSLLLMAGGLLLLVATVALALSSRQGPPARPAENAEATLPEMDRISLEEASSALASGTAVFVDVRDPASYAAAHIPTALSIPLATLEQRLAELDPQARIITYCT